MLTGLSLALPGAVLCNATRRLGNWQRVILLQRVRGSVRAIRAIRNTRDFQTETRVVADVLLLLPGMGWLLLAMAGRTRENCILASVAATTLLRQLKELSGCLISASGM
jgi:hypothetical protein